MQNLKKYSQSVHLKTSKTNEPVWLGFNMSQRDYPGKLRGYFEEFFNIDPALHQQNVMF